jgi:hypothetical protein
MPIRITLPKTAAVAVGIELKDVDPIDVAPEHREVLPTCFAFFSRRIALLKF